MEIELECLANGWERVRLIMELTRPARWEVAGGWVRISLRLALEDLVVRMSSDFRHEELLPFADQLAVFAEDLEREPLLPDYDDGQSGLILFECVDREQGLVSISGEFRTGLPIDDRYETNSSLLAGRLSSARTSVAFQALVTDRESIGRLARELRQFLETTGETAESGP